MPLTRNEAIASWTLQLVVFAILFQTLFFKFTAAEESVYIFSRLGMEPWGRVGSGILELIASVLVLIPSTTPYGALLAACALSGAIFFHLTSLGLVVREDGGLLFGLAVTGLLCSLGVLALRRHALAAAGLAALARVRNA